MLIDVEPIDSKAKLYFEVSISDSTELVTKLGLEFANALNFFEQSTHLLEGIIDHGPMRAEEARGLSEIQPGEPPLGKDVDKELFRCGHRPSERGTELFREILLKIKLLSDEYAERNALEIKDFDNLLEFAKGSVMIAYPEGIPHDPISDLLGEFEEYRNGEFNEDGFYSVETGALFFCNKPLIQKGESMKCLNCTENSTIKVIPSKSATYAPRNSEDQMRADMMRFAFEREKRLKEAELKTEDDAYGREWADASSLKRGMLGINDVRFK